MNSRRKKILVMCLPDPSRNPRPRRAIEIFNSHGYIVDIISATISGSLEFNIHFPIPEKQNDLNLFNNLSRRFNSLLYFRFRKYLPWLLFQSLLFNYYKNWQPLKNIIKCEYDLILVEDLEMLPIAINYKGKARVIFDAREYYPKQKTFYTDIESYDINWICKAYLPKCDTVLTVSNGLAAEYKKEFGIEAVVLRSVPNYHSQKPSAIEPNDIRMVHHGVAESRRKIENMINIFNLLDDRFSLDLYLVTAGKKRRLDYLDELKRLAINNHRIRFFEPLPLNDIVPMLNRYDIGLYYLEPNLFNHEFSLPNKFFEFIQGRLMIAIGPSPDMAELVKKHECGIVSEKFDVKEMARLLNNLHTEDILKAKMNSHLAAKELCFEEEGKCLTQIINSNFKDII